jgi:hypothetical protein
MWVRVRDAIAGALDSMTLADLVPAANASGRHDSPTENLDPIERPLADQPNQAATATAIGQGAPEQT